VFSLPVFLGANAILDFELKNCKTCDNAVACQQGSSTNLNGWSECFWDDLGCAPWGTFGQCRDDGPGEG